MIVIWWHGMGPLAMVAVAIPAMTGAIMSFALDGTAWYDRLLPWTPLALLVALGWACVRVDKRLTEHDPLAKGATSWMEWIEYYPHSLFFLPLRWWGRGIAVTGVVLLVLAGAARLGLL